MLLRWNIASQEFFVYKIYIYCNIFFLFCRGRESRPDSLSWHKLNGRFQESIWPPFSAVRREHVENKFETRWIGERARTPPADPAGKYTVSALPTNSSRRSSEPDFFSLSLAGSPTYSAALRHLRPHPLVQQRAFFFLFDLLRFTEDHSDFRWRGFFLSLFLWIGNSDTLELFFRD